MGQLVMLLRAKYLVDAQGYNKIQGKPFKQSELEHKIEEMLGRGRETFDEPRPRCHRLLRKKIFRPTRKFAGARAAATTRFSPPCSPSSRSSAFRAKNSS